MIFLPQRTTMQCKGVHYMESQLTVRLPADLVVKVRERAKRMRLKRSDVVRMAVREFLEGPEATDRPYERVKHLIGSIRSGAGNLSSQRREDLIQKMRRHNFRD